MKVNGRLYLHLQIIESARFEMDGDDGNMTASQRVAQLSEHLRRKYELN